LEISDTKLAQTLAVLKQEHEKLKQAMQIIEDRQQTISEVIRLAEKAFTKLDSLS
jgi:hypothetical protein